MALLSRRGFPTSLKRKPLGARRSRAASILLALRAARPDSKVELDHGDPFQLLIATILSAQSTDSRVNQVTPGLFRRYPDPAAFADANPAEIEDAIHSTGFFRAKTRAIQASCKMLVARHGGRVPRTLEELIALPGVGRKTANVVLGAGYGIASGIVVDTHMARLARRLGLTRHVDPSKIERDLVDLVPKGEWIFFSIAGVLHGRYICQARRPLCGACLLAPHCPSRDRESKRAAGRPVNDRPNRPPARPRRSRDRS